MRLFNKVPQFNFLRIRQAMTIFSILVTLVFCLSFVIRGLSFGIDFTGGTLLEVGYEESIELSQVRATLAAAGFPDAGVQRFGTPRDVLIRIAPRAEESSAAISDRVFASLKQAVDGKVELRRVEFVGPQVGDELVEEAGLAILYSLIGILVYVALRFEYRFAVGAIVATVHDIIVTVGVFSLFQIEFNLTVLAAVLAVIGYSLNDTIVVFDRIRENFRKIRKGSVEEIVNLSLNETLTRTTITSWVTLLAVLALYFLGGEIIHGFSLALLVGILVGTYSSIYVATDAAIRLGISRADMLTVKKTTETDGSQP